MAHPTGASILIASGAAKVRADHHQLRTIADVFRRETDCVGGVIALLARQTEVLRGGDWIGPGARVFFAEMDGEVIPALRRLADGLLQGSRAVARIQAVFQDAETDAARVLSAPPAADSAGRDGAVDWIVDALDQALDRRGEQSAENPGVDEILYDGYKFLGFGGEAFVDPDGEGGEGAIDITDVDQGGLGDCYFMAALGALAASDPDQIKRAIVAEDATTCTVRLYERGIAGLVARDIVVDKTFLSMGPLNGVTRPEFAGFGDMGSSGPELWPALLEKAYAKMEGGYDEIVGGKAIAAFRAITGNPGERIGPRRADFDELHDLLEQKTAMVMTTRDDFMINDFNVPDVTNNHPLYTSGTLRANHSYSVTAIDPGTGFITLRNPHGPHTPDIVVRFGEAREVFDNIYISRWAPRNPR